MRLTIDIKDDKLEQFFQFLEEHEMEEVTDSIAPGTVPQWHIDEVRRRRALTDQPAPRPWSEIRKQFVERGLL